MAVGVARAVRAVVVAYPGVLRDEFDAFDSVLRRTTGVEVIAVAESGGRVDAVGGAVTADHAFDLIPSATVVAVPGGLGCERAARNPAIVGFLRRVVPDAEHVVASSTGTVLLAAAGVLDGQPAATHWLAHDLLRGFGSEAAATRVVDSGRLITCSGSLTALGAAMRIAERIEGPDAPERIRQQLLVDGGVPLARQSRWARSRRGERRVRRDDSATAPPLDRAPPPTPISVMIELVDDEREVTRLRKQAARRGGR